MKIVATGSLGNISREIVKELVAKGHKVSVITSQPQKEKEIEQMKAYPLVGRLTDADFVRAAFRGADAVYSMVPPDFSAPDTYAFADQIHRNYAASIVANAVPAVVNLSSIGVTFAGQPPLTRFYDLEKSLDSIPNLNLTHLRPAMFYTNFFGSLRLAKEQGIIGHNLAPTAAIPMTHPADIAAAAVTALETPNDHQIKFLVSDVKTGQEIATILGEAIQKPLHWVEFSDEQLLAGLQQGGFSKDAAETLVIAAGQAIREGMFDEFKTPAHRLAGGTPFEQFAHQFARAYQSL